MICVAESGRSKQGVPSEGVKTSIYQRIRLAEIGPAAMYKWLLRRQKADYIMIEDMWPITCGLAII